MNALFAAGTALGATLLFSVQPLVAKAVLPWFGGTAAVWTCCLVFCQVALVAGYVYADWSARSLPPRRQAALHVVLLLCALGSMPIIPSARFQLGADGGDPTLGVLLVLLTTIGLPYVVLAATGPLLQSWWVHVASKTPRGSSSVYRLYALSNAASLAALLLYPTIIEPRADLATQQRAWSLAFAAFVCLGTLCAWRVARQPAPIARSRSGVSSNPSEVDPGVAPSGSTYAWWGCLSGGASALLTAVTAHITQAVAMPLLWVLPLSAYLLTFVLCFDGKGWYWRPWYWVVACTLLVLMAGGVTFRLDAGWSLVADVMHIEQTVPLFLAGLFAVCMVCHGELYERRPTPRYLTRFYGTLAVGGAVGGVLAGVAAPMLFDAYWELPLVLMAIAAMMILMARGAWRLGAAVTGAFVAALGGVYVAHDQAGTTEQARSFYGAIRVVEVAGRTPELAKRRFMHGAIAHGEQFVDGARSQEPTTYYSSTSGVGRALLAAQLAAPGTAQKVGVIGLGVGTLAAYSRTGDTYRFYEINPQVVDLAKRDFSYLSQARGAVQIIVGDARIALSTEPPNRFDVLVVDAFSGDAIPVHLITREAARLYRKHLKPGGILAIHTSNLYVALRPVAKGIEEELAWYAAAIDDHAQPGGAAYPSEWIVMSSDPAIMHALRSDPAVSGLDDVPTVAWTDQHNSLFAVLR